jgi:thiol:disulfide interchange protein DsbD
MTTCCDRRLAAVLGACLLSLALLLPPPATALELEVVSPTTATIGADLVLELVVRADAPPLDGSSLVVEMSGTADLGAAYPPRILDDGQATGVVRLEWAAPVPAGLDPGDRPLTLVVRSGDAQATWQGTIAVAYGDDWSDDRIANVIESRGLLVFLALVFGFGVLMSLSPCIYPMIPITLAVIGGQSQEKGVARGLVMSVTYVLGMALVYALIGLVVATVFSGLTAFMQSPWVVGPIALLLVLLAFGMFGAFELQAPQFLRDKLQGPGGGNRSGLVGVFFMGMVAGLVASPCVGPFLNALLLVIATTGDWLLGFVSLFVFGLGMGLLLIGVGTFPALLGSLPQAGGWMDTVKKGMGLLLVAMAFWFVRPSIFLPEVVFYPLLGATTIVVAIFMGALDSLAADSHWWDRTRKGLGIVVLVGGLYLLGGSLLTHGLLMPSPLATAVAPGTSADGAPAAVATAAPAAARPAAAPLPDKVPWEKIATGNDVRAFLDARRAEAVAAGKPMMIDFWATWCVYCKKLDKDVWNVPDVVRESQRFVTIKIDATAPDDAEMAAIKEEWGVAGLPRVVFIDSRGEFLPGRSTGFEPAPRMLEIMQGIR